VKKPIPFKTLSEGVSVFLRIGGDRNHIQIRGDKILYHGVDITQDFINIIDYGYLEWFLPKVEAEFEEVEK